MSEGPGAAPVASQAVSAPRQPHRSRRVRRLRSSGFGRCCGCPLPSSWSSSPCRGSESGSISPPRRGCSGLVFLLRYWPPRSGRWSGCLGPRAPRSWAGSTGIPVSGTRPAHALVDTLAIGIADPGTRALWSLHRRRAEETIRHMRVAAPRPDMPKRDRYALRAVAILALVASAFVAGPEIGTRLVVRLRLAKACGSRAHVPHRWLDRPAALYAGTAGDDRSGQEPDPSGPDPFHGRDPHRGRWRGRDHGRHGPYALAAQAGTSGRICERSASRSNGTPRFRSRLAWPVRPD